MLIVLDRDVIILVWSLSVVVSGCFNCNDGKMEGARVDTSTLKSVLNFRIGVRE